QVWSWIFTPFVAVYLYFKYGFTKALVIMIPAALLGAVLLAIFILPDPQAYYEHVFGFFRDHSEQALYPRVTPDLAPILIELGLHRSLLLIQIGASALTGLVALFKLRSFKSLLLFLALVLLASTRFKIITWIYMYLNA